MSAKLLAAAAAAAAGYRAATALRDVFPAVRQSHQSCDCRPVDAGRSEADRIPNLVLPSPPLPILTHSFSYSEACWAIKFGPRLTLGCRDIRGCACDRLDRCGGWSGVTVHGATGAGHRRGCGVSDRDTGHVGVDAAGQVGFCARNYPHIIAPWQLGDRTDRRGHHCASFLACFFLSSRAGESDLDGGLDLVFSRSSRPIIRE